MVIITIMKRTVCLCLLMLLTSTLIHAQEKKPTLMILRSDAWCAQRFYMTSYNYNGSVIEVPNYMMAFRDDLELSFVTSKIGELLTKRGYSIKDAEQEAKNVYTRLSEDNVTMSNSSSATLFENPLDMIKRRVKMDILLQISWNINKDTNGKSITFTIEAFDAYTSKRIATTSGTSKVTNDAIPIMLENAVKSHIKQFDKQLTAHYNDIQTNGREIVITIRKWDNWEMNLESEYNDDELIYHIQKWLHNNTVNSTFNLTDATENFAQFEQVRIPLFDNNNMAMDARSFANQLRKHLDHPPFNIESKVMMRGLGEATIILGEK